jgi:hypothetical protein
MRRMVLSESVNKRERPRAFVRHSTATFKMILRRDVLPITAIPFQKDFIPEFPINRASKRDAGPCTDWARVRGLRDTAMVGQQDWRLPQVRR